ncbi:uncharacterized protein LOC133956282 isoform X1 [Platichthys flesus]|uniref:uncharacterized protein LOC133956282 isoform X1 n=1 Tax=Platichthys flesus TaxID=8260 RepID=UPI001A828677|nr:uncharacterized protein LOC133956282 isoform X1 [Platichthys flesus]XP_062247192.1 uncharacterized protein LOC133956282 isoform X1 [Platichthys flesus]
MTLRVNRTEPCGPRYTFCRCRPFERHKLSWSGPKSLYTPETNASESTYELVDPGSDPDIRPLVSTLSTTTTSKQLGSQRFSKFSSWKSLTRAIIHLIHIARLFNKTLKNSPCKGWHHCKTGYTVEESDQVSHIIIQAVQEEVYSQEIKCIQKHEQIPKSSPLKNMDPLIDAHCLLRVGGRLHNANLDQREKTPVIIPGKHQVATLLIKHHHEQIYHQGRLFTEGAIRKAGFWIVGGKRKVSNIIHQCITCRRLRAPLTIQKMASLQRIVFRQNLPLRMSGLMCSALGVFLHVEQEGAIHTANDGP